MKFQSVSAWLWFACIAALMAGSVGVEAARVKKAPFIPPVIKPTSTPPTQQSAD